MKASDILKLLQAKHKADVIIPECKTGATLDFTGNVGKSSILDAWVMVCKWLHPDYIGYEIKVSRSDFKRDKKWMKYLAYCTKFYFVCPYGLIIPYELPEGIGLIYVKENGKRLYVIVESSLNSTINYKLLHNIMKYAMWWRMDAKEDK